VSKTEIGCWQHMVCLLLHTQFGVAYMQACIYGSVMR
jgi:hypothetical protein